MPAGINLSDFYYLLPEIVLTTGALLLLLVDLMTPRDKQSILAWVTMGFSGRRPWPSFPWPASM